MKLYVAEVTWYPDYDECPGPCIEHLIITEQDMAEATAYIASYYGEERVETIKLTCLNPEAPLVRIPEDSYNSLVKDAEI